MAPEVFRHEPYNSRVDVYSFSMIVYQLFEVRCGRCCGWHCPQLLLVVLARAVCFSSLPPACLPALPCSPQFQPPFAGMDPVEAARQAALYERRPEFVALMQPHPQKKVRPAACSAEVRWLPCCVAAC